MGLLPLRATSDDCVVPNRTYLDSPLGRVGALFANSDYAIHAAYVVCACNVFPQFLQACQTLPLDCEFTDAADFKDNAAKFQEAMRLARIAIAAVDHKAVQAILT